MSKKGEDFRKGLNQSTKKKQEIDDVNVFPGIEDRKWKKTIMEQNGEEETIVDIPHFMKKPKTGNRETVATNNNNKGKNSKSKKLSIIGAVGLGAFILIGPTDKLRSYSDIVPLDGKPMGLEELENNPKILKEIETTEENIKQLKDYRKILKDEKIPNTKLIELSDDIYNFGLDVLKDKISVATNIPKEEITVITHEAKMDNGTIQRGGTSVYEYDRSDLSTVILEGWASYFGMDSRQAMSDDLVNYIMSMGKMETIKNHIDTSDLSRSKIKSEYSNALETIEDMLSKEFILDDNVLKTKAIEKEQLHSTKSETVKGENQNYSYTISEDEEER
ncbi:MAG: hypothetical protein HFJ37_02155 [Clostridia bacterium]|nr:hypothetical protein [Clostridia bacterium]